MSLEKYFNQGSKSKADFEQICQLIIQQGSKQYATLLLKNEQFYSILGLPSNIVKKIPILDKFDGLAIKIIEIIQFVKFFHGSGIDLFLNLIYFHFNIPSSLNNDDKLQLQQIIGLVIGDFWWQYEYFKKNTEKNDPKNYEMMTQSLIKYWGGESQFVELKLLSQINKEIRTIINNSTSQFNDYKTQSEKLDLFFLIFVNRGTTDFKTIKSYILSKSIFSKKYRCLYFRLLFHFISLRLYDGQKTNDPVDLFLQKNIKECEQAQLRTHFESIDQLQNQLILNLQTYDFSQFTTLPEFLRWKDFEAFSNQLIRINFEKIFQVFQDRSLILKIYNICFFKEQSFLVKLFHNYNQQPTLNQQISFLSSYLINVSDNQISLAFQFLGNNLLLSFKELKGINQCFQLKSQKTLSICETLLVFLKINCQQDIRNYLKQQTEIISTQFDHFQQFAFKSIIKQKRLKNLTYLFIQTYLEQKHDQTLFNIIKSLIIHIKFFDNHDMLEFFYLTFYKLQYHQLKQITTTETECNRDDLFERQLAFLKQVLENLNKEEQLVIFNNIGIVSFFVQDLHIDFLKKNQGESSESLILYLRILYYLSLPNEILAEQYSLELYRKNFLFFQKHIQSYYNSEKFSLSEKDEIDQGKNEAKIFAKEIFNNLKLVNFSDEKQKIIELIKQETIPSKEFIIKIEQSNLNPQQFYEYTTNQLSFIRTKINQKVQEIRQFFQGQIDKTNLMLKPIELLQVQVNNVLHNLKNNYKSSYYFEEELGLQHEKAMLLLHQIFNDYFILQETQGIQLFKSQFQNLFGNFVDQSEDLSNLSKKSSYIEERLELNQKNLKISCLGSFLETLAKEFEKKLAEIKVLIQEIRGTNLDNPLQNLFNSLIGCQELCPICKKKCDQNPTPQHLHKCESGHQLRAMGGVIVNNMPSLFSCEELQDDYDVFDQQSTSIFPWRTLKQNYQNWYFQSSKTQSVISDLTRKWDQVYGEYYCQQMRIRFSYKSRLDLQDYKGKNIVLSQQKQVKKFHYILVLDDSGSMAGTRFQKAIQGAKQCLQLFLTNSAIKLTIIMFNSTARVVVGQNGPEPINIQTQIDKIKFQGGGTNFNSAFQEIFTSLSRCRENFDKHVILFYTDGEASYPNQALGNFITLDQQIKEKVSLIICCEGNGQESLINIQEFFNQNMEEGKLFQKVRPENLGNIWTENVTVTQFQKTPC